MKVMSYLFPSVLCKLPEEKDGYLFICLFAKYDAWNCTDFT